MVITRWSLPRDNSALFYLLIMKQKLILFGLVLFVAVSCSKEPFLTTRVRLSANLEQSSFDGKGTKSTLSENVVVWSEGDALAVLYNGGRSRFNLTSGAGSTSCHFEGDLPQAGVYYALYPYSSTASYSSTSESIRFSLPSTQTYNDASFGNGASPAVAEFTDPTRSVQFKNVCGVLKLSFRGSGIVENIVVEDGDGAKIWGDFSLATNGMGTSSQNLTYLSNGGSSITLECGGVALNSSVKDFFIVVPPGSFASGFTATVNFVGGETRVFSSSSNQSISRSKIHPLEARAVNVQASFNLENPVVKSYLDYMDVHPYTDGDYTYTYVNDYYNVSTSYRKDRPSPVSVGWNPDDESVTQTVYVSNNSSFTPCVSWDVNNTSGSFDIFNLVPGKTYYWKAVATMGDSTEKILESGSFNTIGRRRFIAIDNICNVRDLGGIPTADGTKRIKYGLVFRSGEMNGEHKDYDNNYCRISSSGQAEFKKLGIAADLDLRTDSEAKSISSSPIGSDISYSRFKTAVTYYYNKFWNSDVYISAFQWLIDNLKAGRPVDFHCIYGADRTGTLGFLIEAVLGVSENQMSIDYELTSFSYGLNYPPRRRGPSNVNTNYKYREMLEGVLDSESTVFTGDGIQERIYNFLNVGVNDVSISAADLDWFIGYMLEDIS